MRFSVTCLIILEFEVFRLARGGQTRPRRVVASGGLGGGGGVEASDHIEVRRRAVRSDRRESVDGGGLECLE